MKIKKKTYEVGTNKVEVVEKKIKPPKTTAEKNKHKKKIAIAFGSIFAVLILAFGIGFSAIAIIGNEVQLDETLLPSSKALPTIFDSNGNEMSYSFNTLLSNDEISPHLQNAFVALEDKRFFEHNGYDVIRIGGAIFNNIKSSSKKEGASTITQQLIKNTHLNSEKTINRKINELFLASELEKKYSKQEILAMYLSVIYFGNGNYGIKQASEYYFSKKPNELNLQDCATLAGIVKNPSKYNPKKHYNNAYERRNFVIELMLSQGYINENEASEAKSKEIDLKITQKQSNFQQNYIKLALKEVMEKTNMTIHQIENSGMKIYTYFDASTAKKLNDEIQSNKDGNLENSGIIIDNATHGIVATSSTLKYETKRQAGSVLKPLVVYAPAFEREILFPCTPIEDKKVNVGGYAPSNFGDIYYGWTTPRDAIMKSMNTVSLQALNFVGTDYGVEFGQKFGLPLSDSDKNLSLALGSTTEGMTVRNLANAYMCIANGGKFDETTYIKRITDKNDVETNFNHSETKQIISESTANLLTDILFDTVKYGTAKTLSTLPFQIASKTGTVGAKNSNLNTDCWNVSYTTSHTMCLWRGNKDTAETGGGKVSMMAKNVWEKLYQDETENLEQTNCFVSNNNFPKNFDFSKTICEKEIDLYSHNKEHKLLLANETTPLQFRKQEKFATNHIPKEVSNFFNDFKVENVDLKISDNQNIFEDYLNFFPDLMVKHLAISFDTKDVFCYSIIKKTRFQEKEIARIENASGNTVVEFYEIPQNQIITYKIVPWLKNGENIVMGKESIKVVCI